MSVTYVSFSPPSSNLVEFVRKLSGQKLSRYSDVELSTYENVKVKSQKIN